MPASPGFERQPAGPGATPADNIEAADIEVGVSTASPGGWQVNYKVPSIAIKNYAGPASLPAPPASASFIEVYRFMLERFATVSASSIEIPSIAGTLNMAPAVAANFTYSGLALRDIRDGKIATLQVERLGYTANTATSGQARETDRRYRKYRLA